MPKRRPSINGAARDRFAPEAYKDNFTVSQLTDEKAVRQEAQRIGLQAADTDEFQDEEDKPNPQ